MESAGAVALAASGALGEIWIRVEHQPSSCGRRYAAGRSRMRSDWRLAGWRRRPLERADRASCSARSSHIRRRKSWSYKSIAPPLCAVEVESVRHRRDAVEWTRHWAFLSVVDASARVTGGSLRTGPISEEGDRPAGYAAVAWDGPGRPAVSPSPGSAGDVCAGEARPRRDEECAMRHQRASSRRVAGVDRLLEQVAQY